MSTVWKWLGVILAVSVAAFVIGLSSLSMSQTLANQKLAQLESRVEAQKTAKATEASKEETPSSSETSGSPSTDTTAPETDTVSEPSEDAEYVYLVSDGETLADISAKTGVSVDEIAAVNQIQDVNLIYRDSALRIPRS